MLPEATRDISVGPRSCVLPVKSYFQNKWTLESRANALLGAVTVIKGKALRDGFSCLNHSEVRASGLGVQLS